MRAGAPIAATDRNALGASPGKPARARRPESPRRSSAAERPPPTRFDRRGPAVRPMFTGSFINDAITLDGGINKRTRRPAGGGGNGESAEDDAR